MDPPVSDLVRNLVFGRWAFVPERLSDLIAGADPLVAAEARSRLRAESNTLVRQRLENAATAGYTTAPESSLEEPIDRREIDKHFTAALANESEHWRVVRLGLL